MHSFLKAVGFSKVTKREEMKEIILDVQESAPREISRGILERVLSYSDYRARDDMTVLVASVVRK